MKTRFATKLPVGLYAYCCPSCKAGMQNVKATPTGFDIECGLCHMQLFVCTRVNPPKLDWRQPSLRSKTVASSG